MCLVALEMLPARAREENPSVGFCIAQALFRGIFAHMARWHHWAEKACIEDDSGSTHLPFAYNAILMFQVIGTANELVSLKLRPMSASRISAMYD